MDYCNNKLLYNADFFLLNLKDKKRDVCILYMEYFRHLDETIHAFTGCNMQILQYNCRNTEIISKISEVIELWNAVICLLWGNIQLFSSTFSAKWAGKAMIFSYHKLT